MKMERPALIRMKFVKKSPEGNILADKKNVMMAMKTALTRPIAKK